MPELLIVGVDFFHASHAGIVVSRVFLVRISLIPIENAANERRDELRADLSAGYGLR